MPSIKLLRGQFQFSITGELYDKESYRHDFIDWVSKRFISSKVNTAANPEVVKVADVTITNSGYGKDENGVIVREAVGRFEVTLTPIGTTLDDDDEAFERNVQSVIKSLLSEDVPPDMAETLTKFTITYDGETFEV